VLARQLDLPNVSVRTIDQLIGGALTAARMERPSFDSSTLGERAALALQALDKGDAKIRRYDHVLVDEAQDFPTEALQLVVRLLADGADSLLVVADAAQNIYRQKFTWKAAGINASGRTRILSTSYRNTREILQYAHDFLLRDNTLRIDADGSVEDESAVIPPHYSDRPGPLPAFRYCASPQAEVVAIADHCQALIKDDTSPGDIGILYGRTTIQGFKWPQSILAALSAAGVAAFWATDREHPQNRSLIGADPTKVTVSTIHAAKGLEFKHVILCGYLDDLPPERQLVNRRVIYVGMTRATHELVLTASGRHEYIADLEL
jgi:superfamily I DNA/RNA helicase